MIGVMGLKSSEITRRAIRSLVPIALFLISTLSPVPASAGVFVSISVPPPPLPVYVQPFAPGPDFIWAPGYWAYDGDYYWVPGTWVRAPGVGLLWTPGYWGWNDGFYVWHTGYWGPHVGFYGGINYGCGYTGSGYWGGHWDHGAFYYNTAVTHVNTTLIHNTYNTVVVNKTVERVSFNGGQGGINAKPSAAEVDAGHEHHVPPTSLQVQHQHVASTDKASFASVNHGSPHITATARAGVIPGHKIESLKSTNLTSPSQQPSKALASIHSHASTNSNFQNSQISSHEHHNIPPHGAPHSPRMAAHHGQGHERPAGPPHQGRPKKEHG
jgi:hypothetical protein